MSNRQTSIQAQGDNLHVTQHESDSPILPVAQLERLHQFRPDLVDWVVNQTTAEANTRWARQRTTDCYIFVERISGLVFGFVIAIAGFCASVYLAMNGHDGVAFVVGGGILVGIVAVLVKGRPGGVKPQPATPGPRRRAPKK